MKGGSATKICLDLIISRALFPIIGPTNAPCPLTATCFHAVNAACTAFYDATHPLAAAVDAATAALRSGGAVRYLGIGTPGIWAAVDAAECVSTFGARYEDVRGFLAAGFVDFANNDGDLSTLGADYAISLADFARYQSPVLGEKTRSPSQPATHCVVLVIPPSSKRPNQVESVVAAATSLLVACEPGSVSFVVIGPSPSSIPGLEIAAVAARSSITHIPIPNLPPWPASFVPVARRGDQPGLDWNPCEELCFKWACNAISTGAHVRIGKVFNNRMIDLRLSNTKLYTRSINIVASIAQVSAERALVALTRVIYDTDTPSAEHLSQERLPEHVAEASKLNLIVPMAVLLAVTPMSRAEAREAVSSQTRPVSEIVQQHLASRLPLH
jgi:hypothetical protein